MNASFRLLPKRRFLPLFATQFLGAFNDNLFKTAMVLLITFRIYSNPSQEAAFNAIAGGLFILPFFLFSAIAGQLADSHDKARIIRLVKNAEVAIMIVGAAGLLLPSVPMLLAALFAMGTHSAFFGPVKYSILPQHLEEEELLGGTGLVEAGTYAAILLGTIVGGIIPPTAAAALVIATALIGRLTSQAVPPAPPQAGDVPRIDRHIIRASIRLVRQAMHVRRLFLAILSISFFWAVGTVLASQFPPLVKNGLGGDEGVATLFLTLFSLGIALGSILINRLLCGHVSARWAPASAVLMGAFVLDLYFQVHGWPHIGAKLHTWREFAALRDAWRVMLDLTGVAVAGGMFVVPLYTFLQTTVSKGETSRTIAANNIINSLFMVGAALLAAAMAMLGFSVTEVLLLVVVGCLGAAALAWRLHLACD